MTLPRIALVGATGNLGLPILSALLSAEYPLTVLTRVGGNSSKLPSHANLTIKHVDFTSVSSLSKALHGVEIVISCLTTSAMGSQAPLIDASVQAGVKRFVPAEFGMDSQNPLAMQLPVCIMKVNTQKLLRAQSEANPYFTWTAIANGLFLDWGLEMGFILDVAKRTGTLYNGGDVPFSATILEDIAKAVIGVVRNQHKTANRVIYVQSARVTQNQLIQYVKDKDGKEWNIVVKSTEAVKQESFDELGKGNAADVDTAMLGFSIVGMFNSEYGCDFSGRLDNDIVGIREMDETELRAVVAQYL